MLGAPAKVSVQKLIDEEGDSMVACIPDQNQDAALLDRVLENSVIATVRKTLDQVTAIQTADLIDTLLVSAQAPRMWQPWPSSDHIGFTASDMVKFSGSYACQTLQHNINVTLPLVPAMPIQTPDGKWVVLSEGKKISIFQIRTAEDIQSMVAAKKAEEKARKK